jgi:hypothetical protein
LRANECEARHVLAWVATRRGDLAEARAQLSAATSVALAIARPALLVHSMRLFAALLAAQGAPDLAARVMTLVLEQSELVAAEREEAEQQRREWSGAESSPRAWPGPPLETLAQRVVTETNAAYGPLIAELSA